MIMLHVDSSMIYVPKIFVFRDYFKIVLGHVIIVIVLLFYIKSSFHRNSKERSSLSRHFSNSFRVSCLFHQILFKLLISVVFSLSLTIFCFLIVKF